MLVGARASGLGQWIVDDAAVTYAYARSADEGLGLVQQAGAAPVEGYSNPAWLALLVVGRRIGLFDHGTLFGVSDLAFFPKVLALLCVAGILACVATTARTVVPARAWVVTLLTGGALAANLSFVAWSFSGLENPLYGLAAAGVGAVLVRGAVRDTLTRPRTAATAAAIALAAALTRPDGAVLALAHPLAVLLLLRRDGVVASVRAVGVGAAVFAVPYSAFLLARHAVFGLWVPNTAVAKAQSAPELSQLARSGDLLVYGGWALCLVGAATTGVVLARPGSGPARRALATLLVPLALTLLSYGVLGQDWMPLHRFATPVWVLGTTVVVLSAVAVWQGERPRGRAVLACVLVGACVLALTGQDERNRGFTREPTLSMCFVADRFGRTFNSYADRLGLPAGATLAMSDLGGTLLTSRLRVIDLAGLTDRRIAAAYAAGDPRALRSYVLREVRPDLMHVHRAWVWKTGLTADRLKAAGYEPLYRQEDGGDYVRTAAVGDPGRIPGVRAWARPRLDRMIEQKQHGGRLGGCGGRLTVGQELS
ncbi:hypothetical protein B1H18_30945 [Streptomyces tsukubensis]|uniref:Glycosyltransferase RgtA/B/C/D-like domain-containing protein n=1 Tax=Streptomyces tsukubensis TaxID=83656 RepID=A0A1V4A0U8_9ACTN|nr:hypothetical protein B1H18_30945 [Streptomyces tsukubensis]